jgi:hypothetical protein
MRQTTAKPSFGPVFLPSNFLLHFVSKTYIRMYYLVRIEKERKNYLKNLPMRQTTVSTSFGPVFVSTVQFPVTFRI